MLQIAICHCLSVSRSSRAVTVGLLIGWMGQWQMDLHLHRGLNCVHTLTTAYKNCSLIGWIWNPLFCMNDRVCVCVSTRAYICLYVYVCGAMSIHCICAKKMHPCVKDLCSFSLSINQDRKLLPVSLAFSVALVPTQHVWIYLFLIHIVYNIIAHVWNHKCHMLTVATAPGAPVFFAGKEMTNLTQMFWQQWIVVEAYEMHSMITIMYDFHTYDNILIFPKKQNNFVLSVSFDRNIILHIV